MPTPANASPTLPDLARVQAAEERIRDQIVLTPALYAADLSGALNLPLWLKAENLQRTGSFKARGALNWVRSAKPVELAHGLVTVSAGNHAIALAWAGAQVGAHVKVVMPAGSSQLKIDRSRALGAEVIVHGTIQEAVALSQELQQKEGRALVHPYDDAHVMAGQGTVGLELVRQCPRLARVLCPVGGGGLISGLGIVLKALRPDVELIGIEPIGAATLQNAWAHGTAEAALAGVSTVATSLAPTRVGRYTFAASREVVDRMVTVSDRAIAEATVRLLIEGRIYAEPGAAVGLAALLEGAVERSAVAAPTAIVVSGGNMDLAEFDLLRQMLQVGAT